MCLTGVQQQLIACSYFITSRVKSSSCHSKPHRSQPALWPKVKIWLVNFSDFLYQMATSIYLSQTCGLHSTMCLLHTDLENIACLANSTSSGGTVTICPVRVSLAHLGSSGSITFFLRTEKKCSCVIAWFLC